MNIDVKQRVVGAIVLVSLAVIVLPFLLPGKGDLAINIEGSNIPPTPDYRFPPLDEAPEPPSAPMQMTVPLGLPAVEGSAAAEDAAKDQSAAESPTTESPTAAVTETPVGATPPELQKERPVAKSMPEPGEVSGWIVQLGSFSNQTNALALRDKLRAKGYATFVEPVKSDGNTVYRVRIGPELSQVAADKLRQKLMQDLKMKGLVQKYP